MKRTIVILLFIIGNAKLSQAQHISNAHVNEMKKKGISLYIAKLSNGAEIKTQDLITGPSETLDLEILSTSKMKQYYPDDKADVIFIYTLKPEVKLIKLNQILDKYSIDAQYRNYEVLVDDIEVRDRNNLWVSEAILQDVVINETQKLLVIHTKTYPNFVKARKEAEADKIRRAEEYKRQQTKQ